MKINAALPSDRARLAMDVLRFTGLRCSTLLRLGPVNIVKRAGEFWIVTMTKRGRVVELGIPRDLAERLLGTPGPWFSRWSRQAFYMLMRRTAMKTIGRSVSLHDWRRNFITRYYEASGNDLIATARAAGHSSSSTTTLYVSWDERRHRKTLEAL